MHYVYLLSSDKLGKFYIGHTSDLKERFYQHNKGRNASTKAGVPWELIYYEAFQTKTLAIKRESNLKRYGRGLVELKKRIGFC